MNDEDIAKIQERGGTYQALVKYPEWKYLVAEIERVIENDKDSVMADLKNARMMDKAKAWGMKYVIDLPTEAIKELKDIQQENS